MAVVKMAYGVLAMLSTVASEAVASCNSEQKEACRKSAIDDSLDLLSSGGQCLVRQYVQFTHVCTVTNYLPSTDSCCCVHQALVLCCRYHQDWNHFRCVETDDTVHQFQDNVTMSLHLKLIIPLVLLAILVIFFLLLCPVLKFLRCRSNSSNSSVISRLCSSAWGSASDANPNKSSAATSRCARTADQENGVQLIPVPRPVQPRRNSFPESHLSSAEEGSQTVLIPLVCSPPLPSSDHLRTGVGQPEHYRVCHLAIDGGTNGAASSVTPVIYVGCNGGGAHAHGDDDLTERTHTARAAVERIYVALEHPPTYEEATATRTLSTPVTEARTST